MQRWKLETMRIALYVAFPIGIYYMMNRWLLSRRHVSVDLQIFGYWMIQEFTFFAFQLEFTRRQEEYYASMPESEKLEREKREQETQRRFDEEAAQWEEKKRQLAKSKDGK